MTNVNQKPESEQIDDIIKLYGGWRGDIMAQIRAAVLQADPDIVEEVKWRMKSRPQGLPVWSHSGIVCIIETFNNDVKLVFFKGAAMKDPSGLFNARLMSKTDRAIQFNEGDKLDVAGVQALVNEGVALNEARAKK